MKALKSLGIVAVIMVLANQLFAEARVVIQPLKGAIASVEAGNCDNHYSGVQEEGKPHWWWWVKFEGNDAIKEGNAKDGNVCVKVPHPGRVETYLLVKKGQKVTVSVWIKKAK